MFISTLYEICVNITNALIALCNIFAILIINIVYLTLHVNCLLLYRSMSGKLLTLTFYVPFKIVVCTTNNKCTMY